MTIVAWILAHFGIGSLLSLVGGGGILAVVGRVLGFGRIRTAIGANRQWLLLLAVGIAAAGLYAWGAIGRSDRDQLAAWARVTCASAGADFDQGKGKRGSDCAAAVKDIAAFKTKTAQDTANILVDHLNETQRKTAADATRSRINADRADAAAAAMEKANAGIGPDDRVGRDWWRSFNDAAGLHP